MLSIQGCAVAFAADVPTVAADPTIAASVPAAYRQRGTLSVAVNPEIAPIKFIDDDGEIAGFTPDLLSAAAKVLNLKLTMSQSSFDALIPGLASRRFDVLLSLGDFPSRHEKVTFVDYLGIGEAIVGKPDTTLVLKSLDDLCGLQVALPRGSATVQKSAVLSERCVKNGNKPLVVATYPDSNMALLSLSTGASNVAWVDSPAADYNVKKFPTKYKLVYFERSATYGIGFGADADGKQLAAAVQRALLKLQQDGVVTRLLKKWGLSEKDLKASFPINGAME